MLPKYLKPFAVKKGNLLRLGPQKDGGYIIHRHAFKYTKKIITLGLSDDWEFEKSFLFNNKHVIVEAYDHTVTFKFWALRLIKDIYNLLLFKKLRLTKILNIFKYLNYLIFFKKNKHFCIKIGNKKKEINLKKILYKYPNNYSILLKIDIEGDEYKILNQLNGLDKKINTILIEFHPIQKVLDFKLIKNFLKKNKNFKIIHIHGNNYAPVDKYENPTCIELTLVNTNIIKVFKKRIVSSLPLRNLDFPNNRNREDVIIRFAK